MATVEEIKQIVGEVLHLGDQIGNFDGSTALLGSIPEFDSMAVVSVITAIEDNYGVVIDDDEISADVFETIGTLLSAFVSQKAAS